MKISTSVGVTDHVGSTLIWFCGSATISCPDRRLSSGSCARPHCGSMRWNSAATTLTRLARSVWSTDAKIADAVVGAECFFEDCPARHTGRHAAILPKGPFQRVIKQAVRLAPSRCAIRPGARRRPRPDAEIVGGEVSFLNLPFRSRHSITSASNCNELDTSRPSTLAVWRLMTNSNLVDCKTGSSAGLAPWRI